MKGVLLPLQLKPFCYNRFFGSGGGGEVSVLLIDLAKRRPCLKFLTVSPDDSQNPEALKGQMEQFGQAMVFAQDVETLKNHIEMFCFMKHVIFMNHLFFWVMRYFTPRFLYTKLPGRNVTL